LLTLDLDKMAERTSPRVPALRQNLDKDLAIGLEYYTDLGPQQNWVALQRAATRPLWRGRFQDRALRRGASDSVPARRSRSTGRAGHDAAGRSVTTETTRAGTRGAITFIVIEYSIRRHSVGRNCVISLLPFLFISELASSLSSVGARVDFRSRMPNPRVLPPRRTVDQPR
jgi:hypothetical protein